MHELSIGVWGGNRVLGPEGGRRAASSYLSDPEGGCSEASDPSDPEGRRVHELSICVWGGVRVIGFRAYGLENKVTPRLHAWEGGITQALGSSINCSRLSSEARYQDIVSRGVRPRLVYMRVYVCFRADAVLSVIIRKIVLGKAYGCDSIGACANLA